MRVYVSYSETFSEQERPPYIAAWVILINLQATYLQSYHLSQKVNLCTIVMMEDKDWKGCNQFELNAPINVKPQGGGGGGLSTGN